MSIVAALAVLLSGVTALAAVDATTASTLRPAGAVAQLQKDLFVYLLWIGSGIFVVVVSLLLYAVFRFRSRDGGKAIPKQVHGSAAMEIAWTIVPVLIVIAIAVPTVRDIFALAQIPEDRDDALKIEVIGHQWWWEFRYPDLGITTANELYIPTGTLLDITLISDDVIHSFWVPQIGGKMDVNPHRPNRMWLQADEPGVYLGQCAEFCGVNHSLMRFRVIAVEPEEFDAWVNDWRAMALALQEPQPNIDELEGEARDIAQGRAWFELFCTSCHVIEGIQGLGGTTSTAPSLSMLGRRLTIAAGSMPNTRENLIAWIKDPHSFKADVAMSRFGGAMPGDPEDKWIEQVATFLHSLK